MRHDRKYLEARLLACKRLYFKYRGREHARIEREMRASGFPDFNRRSLYAREHIPGWIEKYRWDDELEIAELARFQKAAPSQTQLQRPARVGSPHVSKGPFHELQAPLKKPARVGSPHVSKGFFHELQTPLQRPARVGSPHVSKGPVSKSQRLQKPSRGRVFLLDAYRKWLRRRGSKPNPERRQQPQKQKPARSKGISLDAFHEWIKRSLRRHSTGTHRI